MSDTPTSPFESDSDRIAARLREVPSPVNTLVTNIGWGVLIVVTLYVCYFSQLGSLGFVGPDEPRYAWIARAMAESGDWVTPRLYGVPWFEKPVLYYWGAGLSFKIFGVSEAAARLPSAVSALLATLALGWLAWRIYGTDTARWLLLLLPTTVGMIGFSHAAATDMPFSGMLTVAMVCAAVVLGLTRNEKTPILPRTPWVALILFGFFLGLAVLAKGPAAIVLSGGGVFFWAVFTKRWRDAFRLLHPVAVVTFCATALPWYILCARRNPDFFRVFIIEHNFKRFLTPEFQHIQPFWYYVPVLLVAFLPWTGTLLWSAAYGSRRSDGGDDTTEAKNLAWFLLCWAGFCMIFFSASHSKLPGYVLPAIPAMGLLVARAYVAMASDLRESFRMVHLATGIILIAGSGFAALTTKHLSPTNTVFVAAAGAALVLIVSANTLMTMFGVRVYGESHDLLAASAVGPVLLGVVFANLFFPTVFHSKLSAKGVAEELQRRRVPASTLSVSGMNRGLQYGLSFYLHREIKEWDAKSETGGYLLTASKDCGRVVGAEFFCEAQPFDADGTGRFLYLVIPIAGGK